MKQISSYLLGLSTLLLGAWCTPAAACPDCHYESCFLGACACLPTSGCVIPRAIDPGRLTERAKTDPIGAVLNPIGTYNTSGIPTPSDVVEFAIKNPDQVISTIENPGRLLYTPVAAAMVAARNAVVQGGGQPIPQKIKAFLRRWHSDQIINSVRWTSNWGAFETTIQAAQMRFNEDTQAITVLNAVIFRDDEAANDPALWAHEMLHVQQYRDWGVTEFARSWVNNSSRGGPVESPAYARGEEAKNLLSDRSDAEDVANADSASPSPPVFTGAHGRPQLFPSGWALAPCGCWGYVDPRASMAAPACQSGVEIPRQCGPLGMCAAGSAPWQRACL